MTVAPFARGCAVTGIYLGKVVLFVGCVTAFAAVLCEFGQAGYLKSPRLIVNEMKLESVETVVCHHIHKLLHLVESLEVACHIYHHASVAIVRPVFNHSRGQFASVHFQQTLNSARGGIYRAPARTLYHNAFRSHCDTVILRIVVFYKFCLRSLACRRNILAGAGCHFFE